MKTVLIFFVIIECLALVLLSLLKKLTKTAFLVIAGLTIVCCVGILAFGGKSYRTTDTVDERSQVYMAARLIEEGYYKESMDVLSGITDEGADQWGVQPIRALSYNMNQAFHTSESYLNSVGDDMIRQTILEASKNEEPVDPSDREIIINNSLNAVNATETEIRQWETEMKVRFMGFAPTAEEKSILNDPVAQMKTAVSEKRYQDAYLQAASLANRGNIKAAILVSKLFADNSVQSSVSDADSTYAQLWQEAAMLRADLNMAAVAGREDSDSASAEQNYELLKARYELAMTALNEESVKRSINYLNAFESSVSSDRLGYQLQLARLAFMENRRDESKDLLEEIFSDAHDDSLWLGRDITMFRDAYIRNLSDQTANEYSILFDGLMRSLYQGVYDDASDEDFKSFVMSCMQEFFGGINIQKVNTAGFPQVSVEVYATRSELNLNPETIILKDTGSDIDEVTITANEAKDLSVAIVLDRSGSMEGDNISESKLAIRNCISQMGDQVAFSLVSFNDSAVQESSLTKSYYLVMSLVDNITANGGTNISSGLATAIESLNQAEGHRVIILLSDGIDFPESKMRMEGVLADAISRDITVYTVGLEGCEEAYLRYIAETTGGQFTMVSDPALLQQTYQNIQSMIMESYTLTYRAADQEDNRIVELHVRDSKAEARKYYSLSDTDQSSAYYVNGLQEADYYRQIGGTDIGRG